MNKMTNDEISNIVKGIFVREFEVEEGSIKPESLIYEELGLDSLDSVDLIVALEKAFGFKVDRVADGPQLTAIRKISDIYDYIDAKRVALGK
jgi:acyl carrier protein